MLAGLSGHLQGQEQQSQVQEQRALQPEEWAQQEYQQQELWASKQRDHKIDEITETDIKTYSLMTVISGPLLFLSNQVSPSVPAFRS